MTATMTATQAPPVVLGDVTIPAQQRMPRVEWNRKTHPGGRVVVQLRRTGVEHLLAQLRAGVGRCFTILQDLTVDELVAAVGMSGQTLTAAQVAADPHYVAHAALATLDNEGANEVRTVAWSTRAVLTRRAKRADHATHAAVWPTLADYQRCHDLITTVVNTLPLVHDEEGDE